jgi:hypothetical protein
MYLTERKFGMPSRDGRALGHAQRAALDVARRYPGKKRPDPGVVTGGGLVRRHTLDSLAHAGLLRARPADDGTIYELTKAGKVALRKAPVRPPLPGTANAPRRGRPPKKRGPGRPPMAKAA